MNDESSPLANDGESLSKNRSKWKAVFLIYRREMIDQLRDRRTLFTVAILPIMLYPLLGMILFQVVRNSNKSIRSLSVFLGKTILMYPYRFLTAMDLQKNSKTVARLIWSTTTGAQLNLGPV